MVPRNRLGRQQMTKLKIYDGPTHPHQAQQPQELKLESVSAETIDRGGSQSEEAVLPRHRPAQDRVARVRMTEGTGQITINGRTVEQYFTEEKDRTAVYGPLDLTDMRNRLDVTITIQGGGFTGQAGAASQGIARALKECSASRPRRPLPPTGRPRRRKPSPAASPRSCATPATSPATAA